MDNQSFIPLSVPLNMLEEDIVDDEIVLIQANKSRQELSNNFVLIDKKALAKLSNSLKHLQTLHQMTIASIKMAQDNLDDINRFDSLMSMTVNGPTNFNRPERSTNSREIAFKLADSNSWCQKCFTSQPSLNEVSSAKFFIFEAICSHYICSDCITSGMREFFLSNDDVKCPFCKIVLIKLLH